MMAVAWLPSRRRSSRRSRQPTQSRRRAATAGRRSSYPSGTGSCAPPGRDSSTLLLAAAVESPQAQPSLLRPSLSALRASPAQTSVSRTRDDFDTLWSMRILAATLLVCSLGLLAAGWADAPRSRRRRRSIRYEPLRAGAARAGRRPCRHRSRLGFHVGIRVCVGMGHRRHVSGRPTTVPASTRGSSSSRALVTSAACSLMDARYTRWRWSRRRQTPRRRGIRWLARRLLHVSIQRQVARAQCESGTLPLHRRAACGPREGAGERHGLHRAHARTREAGSGRG